MAEVAALLGIPLGVARVLLADMLAAGAVQVHQVLVRTADPEPDEKRSAGLATLLVEKDRDSFPDGITGRPIDKIGYHGFVTWYLEFDGFRVPVGNQVGKAGFAEAQKWLNTSRPCGSSSPTWPRGWSRRGRSTCPVPLKSADRRFNPAGCPPPRSSKPWWWECHIVELLHGLPPDAPSGAVPKPEYDPRLQSLTGREQAKATELSAGGHRASASTVKHRRQRYQVQGVVGLVDHRVDKKTPPFGRGRPSGGRGDTDRDRRGHRRVIADSELHPVAHRDATGPDSRA